MSTQRDAGPYGSIIGRVVALPPSTNTPGVAEVLFAGYDCAGMLFEEGCCLQESALIPRIKDEVMLPIGVADVCLVHHMIPLPSKQFVVS
jgi:hypothetical protein